MLKACATCGKIHDKKIQCKSKIKYIKNTELDKFRSTQEWKDKREDIKKRDEYMCQACFHNLKGTMSRINCEDLSVHHIRPLRTNYELRLSDNNLITLCSFHHELAENGRIPAEQLLEIVPPYSEIE